MKEIDRRLDRMIEISDQLGVTLDHVVAHMGRCSKADFEALYADPSPLKTNVSKGAPLQ